MASNVPPSTLDQMFTNEFRGDEQLLDAIMTQLEAWREEIAQIAPVDRTVQQEQHRQELILMQAQVHTLQTRTRQRAEVRDGEITQLKQRGADARPRRISRSITSIHP